MPNQTLPIQEEYFASLCEIKSERNDLLATGAIGKVEDEFITILDERRALPLLPYNMVVKVNIFNQELGFKVLTGKIYISTKEFIKISDVLNLLDYERRNFFRVPIKMPGTLLLPLPEEDIVDDIETFQVRGRVLDLSLNGMLLTCEEPLKLGQEFDVIIHLSAAECRFHCVVRRIETVERRPNRYGCEFLGVKDPEQRNLCMFLFQAQRQQIIKNRNNLPQR